MAIKNYTTTIDVYQSIGEIQGALASHGARKIIVDYETDGRPCALAFAYEGTWDRWHETWDSTLKPSDRPIYGWEANPWVWVVGFERVSKEVTKE